MPPLPSPVLRLLVAALAVPSTLPAQDRPTSSAPCCTITLQVQVPAATPTVFVTGSLPRLGPWRADAVPLDGDGMTRRAALRVPSGTSFEYKFTLGNWDREALGYAGAVPPNHRITVGGDTTVTHMITDFKREQREYLADWQGSGVRGRLVYWRDVPSRHLEPTRHVEIWLPPGYETDSTVRYPVLYMHDGQNLFDPRIANTGTDWGVDEAITALVDSGVMPPVIVVGVWSTALRGWEYSPWHGADRYARFLIEELMPRVNAAFRTRVGPRHTAVMGSSMGGLLSQHLVRTRPDVFGACGCLSTHFPLSEAVASRVMRMPDGVATPSVPDTLPYILREIAAGASVPVGVRLWFDYGTAGLDSLYAPSHAAVRAWLQAQGRVEGQDFVVRRYDGADHNEASWRARLADPLRFLFSER